MVRGGLVLNLNPQPSNLNPQPSTLNPQPSTLNPQPSMLTQEAGSGGYQGLKRVDPVYALPVETLQRMGMPVWEP